MTLADLADRLGLQVKAGHGQLQSEVTGGYASDLLSDVIANARAGDLWITLQRHVNIVAVASMKDLAGVVLVNGRQPEEETIEKAEAEHVPLLVSGMPTFELAGRLCEIGLRRTVGKP